MTDYFVSKVVPCPQCKGTGTARIDAFGGFGKPIESKCPTCGGSGNALQMVPLIEALAEVLAQEFCVALPNHPGAGQIVRVPRGNGKTAEREAMERLGLEDFADDDERETALAADDVTSLDIEERSAMERSDEDWIHDQDPYERGGTNSDEETSD